MTKVYRTRQGEDARRAYKRSLAERKNPGDLPPPGIPDALPDDPDGLLPNDALYAPIRVQVQPFALGGEGLPIDPNDTTVLKLQWRRYNETEFHDASELQEFKNIDIKFPLPLEIAEDRFEGYEGQFFLRVYIDALWSGNTDWSREAPIRLDRTAPYGHRPTPNDIPLKIELTSRPITTATLTAQSGAECEIPDFDDPDKSRIIVAIGWGDAPPDPDEIIIPAISGPLLPSRKMTVPRDKIEPLGSGTHYVTYVLMDPAGNISKLARVESVSVALGDLPTNLRPHSVPLHDDLLINRADAAAGVTVDIPLYDNHAPEDLIFVEWGDTLLPPYPVGEDPDPVISIRVNWARLKAEYDFDAGGVQIVEVGYRVERAPQVEYRPVPPTIDINVDFSMTGPIDPGDPDPNPVNPLLDLVTVYSDSGSENEVPEADFGKPAVAKFKAPDPIVDGDTFTLYWRGVAVVDTYVSDGTDQPDDEISINITWDEINEGGSHTQLPVYYVMSHADFPNNDQESRVTHVKVDAIRIIPDAPIFSDIGTGNTLNCNHLRLVNGEIGYRMTVQPSTYLEPGEEIELRWRVYRTAADGGTPIPEVDKTETLTIPPNAHIVGIPWFIEYDDHVLPADALSPSRISMAQIDYTTSVDGVDRPSEKTEKRMVIALGSDGVTCRLDEVIAP
jgi:hypothetical protein